MRYDMVTGRTMLMRLIWMTNRKLIELGEGTFLHLVDGISRAIDRSIEYRIEETNGL